MLLVYPPSLDFIVAFVACLRAGVIAVPVYPPDPRRLRKDVVVSISSLLHCQQLVYTGIPSRSANISMAGLMPLLTICTTPIVA